VMRMKTDFTEIFWNFLNIVSLLWSTFGNFTIQVSSKNPAILSVALFIQIKFGTISNKLKYGYKLGTKMQSEEENCTQIWGKLHNLGRIKSS
jgi:hypothetical protein